MTYSTHISIQAKRRINTNEKNHQQEHRMKGTTTGVRAGKLILIIARNYIYLSLCPLAFVLNTAPT